MPRRRPVDRRSFRDELQRARGFRRSGCRLGYPQIELTLFLEATGDGGVRCRVADPLYGRDPGRGACDEAAAAHGGLHEGYRVRASPVGEWALRPAARGALDELAALLQSLRGPRAVVSAERVDDDDDDDSESVETATTATTTAGEDDDSRPVRDAEQDFVQSGHAVSEIEEVDALASDEDESGLAATEIDEIVCELCGEFSRGKAVAALRA